MSAIVQVEVGRRDYPLTGEFKFFKSGSRPTVLVRLTDDAGRQGCGQAVPVESWTYETVETVDTTLRQYLAPAVLGADASDLAAVHARMERAIRPSFSVGQPLAKAAIDLACHDLWGKQAGKPVWALLGSNGDGVGVTGGAAGGATGSDSGSGAAGIRMSWTINTPSLDAASRLLEQGQQLGYTSFNIKLGPPQTAAYDLELVRLVTRFAPDGFHWSDANTSYDLDLALAQAPRLADLGLRALESPLPPNRIRDYQRLKQQGALPILMDEGVVSPVEAAEFAALGMYDGIAMKVARCGGLWPAMGIVNGLRRDGLALFASGLTDPELSLAASVHLFAAAGLTRPAALNGPQYLDQRGTTNDAFRASDDRLRVPHGPGLGVTLDTSALQSFTLAASI